MRSRRLAISFSLVALTLAMLLGGRWLREPSSKSSESPRSRTGAPGAAQPLITSARALFPLFIAASSGDTPAAQGAVEALRSQLGSMNALIEAYKAIPREDLDLRWAAIEAIAKLDDPKSAEFLASIALSPMPAPRPVPAHSHHDDALHGCNMGAPNDRMLELAPREWSAAAIARQYARRGQQNPRLARWVDKVIKLADKRVAQYAAVSLFAQNALEAAHREGLDRRGIYHDFRFLSDDERDALFDSTHLAQASAPKPGQ